MSENPRLLWEPVVDLQNTAIEPLYGLMAGRLLPAPPEGQGEDWPAWWAERVRQGRGGETQTQLEMVFWMLAPQVRWCPTWFVPIDPAVGPRTTEVLWAWQTLEIPLPHFIYEVPDGAPLSDEVERQVIVTRRQSDAEGPWPLLAVTQVGRAEPVTPDLAARLNAGPWRVVGLDPEVLAPFTSLDDLLDDAAGKAHLTQLIHFANALRPDMRLVFFGIPTPDVAELLAAVGFRFGAGPAFLAPTPIQDPWAMPEPSATPGSLTPDLLDGLWLKRLTLLPDPEPRPTAATEGDDA